MIILSWYEGATVLAVVALGVVGVVLAASGKLPRLTALFEVNDEPDLFPRPLPIRPGKMRSRGRPTR